MGRAIPRHSMGTIPKTQNIIANPRKKSFQRVRHTKKNKKKVLMKHRKNH